MSILHCIKPVSRCDSSHTHVGACQTTSHQQPLHQRMTCGWCASPTKRDQHHKPSAMMHASIERCAKENGIAVVTRRFFLCLVPRPPYLKCSWKNISRYLLIKQQINLIRGTQEHEILFCENYWLDGIMYAVVGLMGCIYSQDWIMDRNSGMD